MLTLLLESQSQPTLTLRIPPSKQLALRKSLMQHLLACKIIWRTSIIQNHLPQGFGSYPITMTPYRHTCTPSTLHKLGNANTIANYHEYYQTRIKNGTANGATRNAYLTAFYVPVKPSASFWSTEPCTTKSMRYGQALNKPNLPPLPLTRQCPAYPFWMPTHANKKYDH